MFACITVNIYFNQYVYINFSLKLDLFIFQVTLQSGLVRSMGRRLSERQIDNLKRKKFWRIFDMSSIIAGFFIVFGAYFNKDKNSVQGCSKFLAHLQILDRHRFFSFVLGFFLGRKRVFYLFFLQSYFFLGRRGVFSFFS